MDTNQLIAQVKARFSHNSAKDYLKQKYTSKLIVADQGGLWRADAETLSILALLKPDFVILVDTFGNPVKVDRLQLVKKLASTYNEVMEEWHKEWTELENKR